jgi:phosphatidylinositol-3-phosphatase
MRRVALLAALVALVGCGGSSDPGNARAAATTVTDSHVVVIVMENKERGQVIGSRNAPYVNALARRYASAAHFYGVSHPSLPNYFALTAGTTFGVRSDCTDCQQSGRSIADQLDDAGLAWKAYMGGLPRSCFKGAFSGQYAKKHDPFMYYRSIAGSATRCANVVPGQRIVRDARAGQLPTYSFLAPGLCDDTHDCPVASGDRYLARVVPTILPALGPHGFLVLTWDEGTSNRGGGGRIPTVIAGPDVIRGKTLGSARNHYSTLRTIEDALALEPLAGAADAKPLDAVFKRPPRLR